MESACRHDKAPAGERIIATKTLRRSSHEAPTGRASLHLLARCTAVPDSRCVLVSTASNRVESACRPCQGTCGCLHLCNGAAMIRRLVEQACTFSMHGARRWRTQGACSSLLRALEWRALATMTRHLQVSAPLRESRHEAPSKLAPAPRCTAVADSRCVLVPATSTRVESACRHDQALAGVCPFTTKPT